MNTYEIVTSVTAEDVKKMFDSTQYKEKFSVEAIDAILGWEHELNEGKPFSIDLTSWACSYSEYSIPDAKNDYSYIVDEVTPYVNREDFDSDEEYEEQIEEDFLKELRNQTTVFDLDNGNIVVMSF